MLSRILLTTILALAACGGGGGGSPGGVDTAPGVDSRSPGLDTIQGVDTVDPPMDTTEPDPDTVLIPPDVPAGIDAEPGSLELGEECNADDQCASGLCFAVAGMSGCTLTCELTADCQAFGLLCVAIREGVRACVPPPPSADASCAGHSDCAYPLVCREDTAWCALPECTWDGDCGPDEECEPGTRRCQPLACVSTHDCEHPLEVCSGGTCGEPECTENSECLAGQFCHPTQLQCQDAPPCNDEGGCNMYNQVCVDGMCVPDLCAAPCSHVGEECDPATGECGKSCGDHGDCPPGRACGSSSGLCYLNDPPLALVSGLAGVAMDVTIGQPATMDGGASADPEGEGLAWEWRVAATPPGSVYAPGAVLDCAGSGCQFFPDRPGQFLLGLRVTDPAGAVSTQAQVGVWTAPIWGE